jgi:hypothetical protein
VKLDNSDKGDARRIAAPLIRKNDSQWFNSLAVSGLGGITEGVRGPRSLTSSCPTSLLFVVPVIL